MKIKTARVSLYVAVVMLALVSPYFPGTGDPGQRNGGIVLAQASTAPSFGSAPPAILERQTRAVAVSAATGATIPFMTQNGRAWDGVAPQMLELPHLVLYRNGELTDPYERTLVVHVTGIEVPPGGVTVTLQVETQHGKPDPGEGYQERIPVWQVSQQITNTLGITQTGRTVVFRHLFGETTQSARGIIPTPTDYYSYKITIAAAGRPETDPWQIFVEEYAFLLESQWIVRLPEVQETSAGAAPEELAIYYCDMFPFQNDIHDISTWLPREEVHAYVDTDLVPAMVEAFRVETDEWSFPWHEAWTSYRPGDDLERLSVALTDGVTWYHGQAPSGGHASISLKVSGGYGEPAYDRLTDRLLATFYHELFHNVQRSINLDLGGGGSLDGKEDAYQFLSEGMAVLASSVGQRAVQFSQTRLERAYMQRANSFLETDLKASYSELNPYHAALYWRFLYEQCGGMKDYEDPAAGMQVIGRALESLYAGDVVDIHSSTALARSLPGIMDRALLGSTCPFQTYEESLIAFSYAIYALRLAGGRCTEIGSPAGCGFYDPHSLYTDPEVNSITYSGQTVRYGGADQLLAAGVPSSFGMDFVDIVLNPVADGQALTLELERVPGADAELHVQLLKLVDRGAGGKPQRMPAGLTVPEILTSADGQLLYVIPAIDTTLYNRLGLIITRLDNHEGSDPNGAYTITLHPGTEDSVDRL